MPAQRHPQTIGRFKVLRLLGEGGMGAVYLVEDPLVGRQVALKRLRTDQLELEAMQRLLREATLLARVEHPNVVRIHEAGWIDEGPYLLMDHVEGRALGKLRQPLPPAEAARIVRDLAGAVERLHAEGILHRDIKPTNVLLRPDGSPVLLDFGIARDALAETLTRTGQSLGTPAYMAPEQTTVERSKELSPAVDVYGLGVLAFELLTARPPYLGSPMNVLCALLEEDVPPPSRHAPGVPSALDAIVQRATARDPGDRYPSARALAADLERFSRGQAIEARPSRAPVALAALALASLLASAWVVARAPAAAPSARGASRPPGASRAPQAAAEPELPRWYRRLVDPPPLPAGLVPTEVSGEYRWERTGALLVWVPPGSFRMGSSDGGAFRAATVLDNGRAVGEREVEVRLTRGVFMGKFEVTWGDWARYAEATGSSTPRRAFLVLPRRVDFVLRSDPIAEPYSPPDSHPIVRLTRAEALAYCAWAGLRLPTEAEWARAARGESEDPYVYGPQPEDGASNTLTRDGHTFTAPVGAYPRDRSPYGCYDLGGNAGELVSDFYAPYPQGPLVDPRGPAAGEEVVLRGPSWESDLPFSRSLAYRRRMYPERRAHDGGFRVALDPCERSAR